MNNQEKLKLAQLLDAMATEIERLREQVNALENRMDSHIASHFMGSKR